MKFKMNVICCNEKDYKDLMNQTRQVFISNKLHGYRIIHNDKKLKFQVLIKDDDFGYLPMFSYIRRPVYETKMPVIRYRKNSKCKWKYKENPCLLANEDDKLSIEIEVKNKEHDRTWWDATLDNLLCTPLVGLSDFINNHIWVINDKESKYNVALIITKKSTLFPVFNLLADK